MKNYYRETTQRRNMWERNKNNLISNNNFRLYTIRQGSMYPTPKNPTAAQF